MLHHHWIYDTGNNQVYLLGATGERIIAGIRVDLFTHLLTLSPDFFTERTTGELTSRLTSDVVRLQGVLSYQLSELLRQALYLFGSLALLTLMHSQLTITTLAVAPAIAAALTWARGAGSTRRGSPRRAAITSTPWRSRRRLNCKPGMRRARRP